MMSSACTEDVIEYGKWQRLAVALIQRFDALAGRFGMTPVDRAKIKAKPQESLDSNEERFFA